MINQGNIKLAGRSFNDVHFVFVDAGCKVSLFLIEVPDHIFVLLQLSGVECLGEKIFQVNRVGNTNGP